MLFVLDIMQVTFVTGPIVDLPKTSFKSQGLGTQTKMSNVLKHMPIVLVSVNVRVHISDSVTSQLESLQINIFLSLVTVHSITRVLNPRESLRSSLQVYKF